MSVFSGPDNQGRANTRAGALSFATSAVRSANLRHPKHPGCPAATGAAAVGGPSVPPGCENTPEEQQTWQLAHCLWHTTSAVSEEVSGMLCRIRGDKVYWCEAVV